MEPLNEGELAFLAHVFRWGSEGYPIQKLARSKKPGWIWTEAFGVKGPPVVYPTKKAAFAAVEAYIDVLIERHKLN